MYIFVSENQVLIGCSNSKVEGGKLDVRVVRRQDKVQKESESMADWTLKWLEGSKYAG